MKNSDDKVEELSQKVEQNDKNGKQRKYKNANEDKKVQSI